MVNIANHKKKQMENKKVVIREFEIKCEGNKKLHVYCIV